MCLCPHIRSLPTGSCKHHMAQADLPSPAMGTHIPGLRCRSKSRACSA